MSTYGLNSTMEGREERISELKGRILEIVLSEDRKQDEKIKSLRGRSNTYITGILEKKEKQNRAIKKAFNKIMDENFSNLTKGINLQNQQLGKLQTRST